MSKHLIEVEHLRQYFPAGGFGKNKKFVRAVDDVSFYVEKGETLGLVGESGCGKTTTGRAMLRLYEPTGGRFTFDGEVVFDVEKKQFADMLPYRKRMQIVFQDPYASLDPRMTVGDIVGEAIDVHKLAANKQERYDRIISILERVGLNSEHANRYPHEFSGGQRQRVAMGRAIVRNPKVFLMDEPLSNLDAKLRLEMRTELKRLHGTTNATFVYVTHDQMEAMALSTNVCLMNMAVKQQYAPPLKLYAEPVNMFVADFVGNPSMNFLPFDLQEQTISKDDIHLSVKSVHGEKLKKKSGKVIFGVRPENVKVSADGEIPAKVISSFPYGMETTLVIRCMGCDMRTVVFGSVDYQPGEDIRIGLCHEKACLFDEETQELLAVVETEVC